MTIRSHPKLFLLACLVLGAAATLVSAVPSPASQQFIQAPSPIPPVGSIMAWHADLLGTPALPTTWEPCDGQMITDPQSPYLGQVLPDLNTEARYLRGGVISGTMQNDATAVNGLFGSTDIAPDHTHSCGSAGAHSHWRTDVGGVGTTRGFAAAANQSGSTSTSTEGMHNHSIGYGGAHSHLVSLTGDNETRPITMTVVWIMRIK